MLQIKLYLFGPPRLEVDDKQINISLRKGQALLAYLAIMRQTHSRDALSTLFWPESSQQKARANLRRFLYDLNKRVAPELLAVTPETLGINPDLAFWVDVEKFGQLIQEASIESATSSQLSPEGEQALVTATALYTDDFMAGFTLPDCAEFDEWQFFQREALCHALAQVLQRLSEHHKNGGAFTEALSYARRWLGLDPLHEPAHRYLMQLYALAGQHSAALRQYEECVRILDEELRVPPEVDTEELYEAIRTRRFSEADTMTKWPDEEAVGEQEPHLDSPIISTSPAYSSPVSPAPPNNFPPHNLPPQSNSFVGRADDLTQIAYRLTDEPDCRLLTLVGPGGIGKTRLGLEVAHRLRRDTSVHGYFPDGIFFTPLQALEEPAEVSPAIADAVGYRLRGEIPARQQLIDHLSDKEMLLLLDNFDHLLRGTDLVADILMQAPGVIFLVTSREALKLREEWFYPITGLTFPDELAVLDRSVDSYEALQLFTQMANRGVVNFSLEGEQEHVVRICRLVDGIPLAIELATAWLRTLTCGQVAEEIERNIDILTSQFQDIPERHQSMRAVLEQTWRMLSESEKDVLMRLSFCRGGFRQDAAMAIANATPLLLVGLVEKSMLNVTEEKRFHMHNLLRQFALNALNLEDELKREKLKVDAGQRHSHFYLTHITNLESDLIGSNQAAALDAMNMEFENISAAWNWAIVHNDLPTIEKSTNSLYYYYWFRRGKEGAELFAATLKKLQSLPFENQSFDFQEESAENSYVENDNVLDPHTPASHLDLLGSIEINLSRKLGLFYYYIGDYPASRRHLEISLAAARRLNRPADLANSLNALGTLAGWQGNLSLAQEHLQESLELAKADGYQAGVADTLQQLAQFANYGGDYRHAEDLARESLELCRQLERQDWSAYALTYLGMAAFCQGDYVVADQYYQESHDLFAGLDHQRGLIGALVGLGLLAWHQGDADLLKAKANFEEALAIARQIGSRQHYTGLLAATAQLECDLGHFTKAHQLGLEGLQIAEDVGSQIFVAQNLCSMAAAAVGQEAYRQAKENLSRAIQLSIENKLFPTVMAGLYQYAEILYRELKVEGLRVEELKDQELKVMMRNIGFEDPTNRANGSSGHRDQLKRLLTFVYQHPATWQVIKEQTNQLYNQIT
ncbi:MAG: tetratricopeptide repeat protein [Chloroflexota bacterium]